MKPLSEALSPTFATLRESDTMLPKPAHGSIRSDGQSITTRSTGNNPSHNPLSQAPSASVLMPSLEREIALASRTAWNREQAAQNLAKNPEAVDKLRQEHQRLTWLLYPAHPNEIMAYLGKLVLHFPQTNMEDRHLSMLYEDYIDDLGKYPADMIRQACVDYRHNAENQFFPKVAQLMALINPKWLELKHRHGLIDGLLNKIPSVIAKQEKRIPDEAWAELRREIETA